MDFDNLPHHVLMNMMMYVSIQDRLENVRLVSKRWKSVAEDSFRRQRKLALLGSKERKIKPTDHHSIIKLPGPSESKSDDFRPWWTGMVRYWSNVFSLCPTLEELYIDENYEGRCLDQNVTELLNLLHSHGIKLKSFTYRRARLTEWPFPLEMLESLTVVQVSDELVTKILDQSTNLKHLELNFYRNWPTFPSRLLSLKFYNDLDMNDQCSLKYGFHTNGQLSKLMNSPAFHTIESLERILFGGFNLQTKVFPKLRRVSFDIYNLGWGFLESCNKWITFLEQIPLLESLGLHFCSSKGTADILFSIPKFVDVLCRLKKLEVFFFGFPFNITVNILNVLRSCQNTELSMVSFDCFGEDGNRLNDLLSFLVDMSGNIKHFSGYTFKQPVKVSDLDILRQLHTSHEILLEVRDEDQSFDIQNFVTEEERQKEIVHVEITAS